MSVAIMIAILAILVFASLRGAQAAAVARAARRRTDGG